MNALGFDLPSPRKGSADEFSLDGAVSETIHHPVVKMCITCLIRAFIPEKVFISQDLRQGQGRV